MYWFERGAIASSAGGAGAGVAAGAEGTDPGAAGGAAGAGGGVDGGAGGGVAWERVVDSSSEKIRCMFAWYLSLLSPAGSEWPG